MARHRKELPVYTGWFRYQNTTGQDLLLPSPLRNGNNLIFKDKFFEGDSRFQNCYGIKLVANLSAPVVNENVEVKKEPVKLSELKNEPIVLQETPVGTLSFFEPDGTPLNESTKNKSKEIEMSKKELVEFATLKHVEVNPNWTKEKIIQEIRKKSS